jgi:hypothetical protein
VRPSVGRFRALPTPGADRSERAGVLRLYKYIPDSCNFLPPRIQYPYTQLHPSTRITASSTWSVSTGLDMAVGLSSLLNWQRPSCPPPTFTGTSTTFTLTPTIPVYLQTPSTSCIPSRPVLAQVSKARQSSTFPMGTTKGRNGTQCCTGYMVVWPTRDKGSGAWSSTTRQ